MSDSIFLVGEDGSLTEAPNAYKCEAQLQSLLANDIRLPPGAQTNRDTQVAGSWSAELPSSTTRLLNRVCARQLLAGINVWSDQSVPSVLRAFQLGVMNSRPTTPAGLRRRSMRPVRRYSKVLSSSPGNCRQYAVSCGQEPFWWNRRGSVA
jgi:hypothetical protein